MNVTDGRMKILSFVLLLSMLILSGCKYLGTVDNGTTDYSSKSPKESHK